MNMAPGPVVAGVDRQPLPFGLFSVLTPRTDTDPHWQNGIRWETLGCAPASGIGDPACDPEEETIGLPKNLEDPGGIGPVGEASPITVYGSYNCSPMGHTLEYAQERANEHLLIREEARVEQALWTGDLGNTGFEDASPDVLTSNGVPTGVAVLENWIAKNYGSQGVLHMSTDVALVGLALYALEVRGNRLYTRLGTPVVAGAGYPSEGGLVGTIFATPPLLGYKSEVFAGADPVAAGFDRARNDLHAIAERTYVIGWDPCGVANTEVDLTAPL